MKQPCYNSIALARHQHNLDRQEAKEHWIAAAVDRLLDDEDFVESWYGTVSSETLHQRAVEQANREYQQHLSALENARIDGREGL